MALYFLDYDLNKEKDYPKLYAELSRFGAVRILDSLWCFNHSETTAIDMRDHFGKFLDADDGLCVSEIKSWATRKTQHNPNDL
ncbi:MAG: hypothetical protein KGL39_16370 [Patescibacteria group bacterium]|nr:hypothetical protein [Patescibacteria group bacterium]